MSEFYAASNSHLVGDLGAFASSCGGLSQESEDDGENNQQRHNEALHSSHGESNWSQSINGQQAMEMVGFEGGLVAGQVAEMVVEETCLNRSMCETRAAAN
jgi:hypothetical protein